MFLFPVYCGKRDPGSAGPGQVWRNGRTFTAEVSLKYRRHSPDGFNWGYGGTGPAQLAFALLLDVTKSIKAAEWWHQEFKFQVVGRLADQWVLTHEEIMRWYQKAKPTPKPQEKPDADQQAESDRAVAEESPAPAPATAPDDGIPVLEKADRRPRRRRDGD